MNEAYEAVYYIKRRNLVTGDAQYWSRDTAGHYWLATLEPKQLTIYDNKTAAKAALANVEANFSRNIWTYSIDVAVWTKSAIADNKMPYTDL